VFYGHSGHHLQLLVRHPEHHIFDFDPESLAQWCDRRGLKPFRARQILEWVYRKQVIDPQRMTNLSAADRALLEREMIFLSGRIVADQLATDGTRKLLIEWDGEAARDQGTEAGSDSCEAGTTQDDRRLRLAILPNSAAGNIGFDATDRGDTSRQTECVMIPSLDPSGARRTACISSQVGCPVGCRFCASGLGGLEGNLSAGRIVEQVWRLGSSAIRDESQGGTSASSAEQPGRITNVVFMGMGEPLANLPSVVRAVRTLAADWGMGISARKITISTVGLPRAIEKLAQQLELPVTLALSLHAPNDELRRQLIPWAQYTTISELLAACQRWFEKTGREITLEYTLLGGLNDQPEHAAQLAQVAKSLRANINLIRYNEVAGLPFQRPRTEDVRAFQNLLRARGINVHIRRSRGRDIAAACGQLRHEKQMAR
jgi:23S rRNA (adenine2503-C2)-methyltransferase